MNNETLNRPIDLDSPLCGLGEDYEPGIEPEYVWLANCGNAKGYKSNNEGSVFPSQPEAEAGQAKAVAGGTYVAKGPVYRDALSSVMARCRTLRVKLLHLKDGNLNTIRTWPV